MEYTVLNNRRTNRAIQPKTVKYLNKYTTNPKEALRRDFGNIELELQNENLKKMINLLEGKNKVLEEHCNFLKEKNHYYETRLRDMQENGNVADKEGESEKESEADDTAGQKITWIKDKISGVVFGVALPKMCEIIRKIKEKGHEMGGDEIGRHCPAPKINFEAVKVNLFRVVVVLGTLTVVSGVGYAGYKIWKTRYRHPNYFSQSDDEEDDDSEVFIRPGASGAAANIPKTNSTESFDRPGISTDFESILDTATKK